MSPVAISTSTGGPAAQPDVPRILVVDDEPIATGTVGVFLETHGFVGAHAGSGEAALAALDRRSFDLVVLDGHGIAEIKCPFMVVATRCRRHLRWTRRDP